MYDQTLLLIVVKFPDPSSLAIELIKSSTVTKINDYLNDKNKIIP